MKMTLAQFALLYSSTKAIKLTQNTAGVSTLPYQPTTYSISCPSVQVLASGMFVDGAYEIDPIQFKNQCLQTSSFMIHSDSIRCADLAIDNSGNIFTQATDGQPVDKQLFQESCIQGLNQAIHNSPAAGSNVPYVPGDFASLNCSDTHLGTDNRYWTQGTPIKMYDYNTQCLSGQVWSSTSQLDCSMIQEENGNRYYDFQFVDYYTYETQCLSGGSGGALDCANLYFDGTNWMLAGTTTPLAMTDVHASCPTLSTTPSNPNSNIPCSVGGITGFYDNTGNCIASQVSTANMPCEIAGMAGFYDTFGTCIASNMPCSTGGSNTTPSTWTVNMPCQVGTESGVYDSYGVCMTNSNSGWVATMDCAQLQFDGVDYILAGTVVPLAQVHASCPTLPSQQPVCSSMLFNGLDYMDTYGNILSVEAYKEQCLDDEPNYMRDLYLFELGWHFDHAVEDLRHLDVYQISDRCAAAAGSDLDRFMLLQCIMENPLSSYIDLHAQFELNKKISAIFEYVDMNSDQLLDMQEINNYFSYNFVAGV